MTCWLSWGEGDEERSLRRNLVSDAGRTSAGSVHGRGTPIVDRYPGEADKLGGEGGLAVPRHGPHAWVPFLHALVRRAIGSAGRKMTARPARRGGKEDEVDEQAVFRKVQSVLAERLARDPGEITRESRLQEDLEVDSLDLVDLSMVLEDEYGIDILGGDIGDIVTVGDVVKLVLDRLLEKEGEMK